MSTKAILEDNNIFVQSLKSIVYLVTIYGSASSYRTPETRKTSAESCSLDVARSYFVYYDWGDNWYRVSAIVNIYVIQNALKTCLDRDRQQGDSFTDCNKIMICPFLFHLNGYDSHCEREDIMMSHLPKDVASNINSQSSNWSKTIGDRFSKEGISLRDQEHNPENFSLARETLSGFRLKTIIKW